MCYFSIDSMSEPFVENAFEHIDPEKVPEAISKAVASLPPEQMFELMKQMKQCIQVRFYIHLVYKLK